MMRGIKADGYRRQAEEADRKARECRDPEAQRTYEEIARRWLLMADQMDRLGD